MLEGRPEIRAGYPGPIRKVGIDMFSNPEAVRHALGGQQYIASDEIATILFLAEQLGKPVLAEGPAGVGKTELAKAWAGAAGRDLVRLQCYEGLDESKALYEWEYAKQMLYTQLLRDKLSDLLSDSKSLRRSGGPAGERRGRLFLRALFAGAPAAERHQQRRSRSCC